MLQCSMLGVSMPPMLNLTLSMEAVVLIHVLSLCWDTCRGRKLLTTVMERARNSRLGDGGFPVETHCQWMTSGGGGGGGCGGGGGGGG